MIQNKTIYLASSSPRRSEILTLAGYDFRVISPECDEQIEERDPGQYVTELSGRKAQAGFQLLSDEERKGALVIGADTIVYHDGRFLGKPGNEETAFHMLRELSGQTHEVYTGVTVISSYESPEGARTSFYEKTRVTFYDLSDRDIEAYIRTGEPMDKAGAYGIQGKGCVLVQGICGDYFNVMGLPIARLNRVIRTCLAHESEL